ncbi:MAG: ABC transporter permease [Actinobacteria bacterium]|nr:ABC transporter permease [Actinomycetota bacterium]
MLLSAAVAIAERRSGKPGDHYYAGRSRAVVERSYIAFKSSTWFVILSGFVEPVLYLLSFGYGVGQFIGNIDSGTGKMVSYAAFIAPGLLATSAMNGAIYDSTWNVFFKMHESRLYHGMLATSLGPLDVALGEMAWALLRGLVYAMGFMIVVAPLGLIPSWWGILAIPAAVLIAFGFAAFGMAVTSYFTTFQQMGLINIALLPIFLFSGAFYPLTVFPGWTQALIKALPLWHAIELIRGLTLGAIDMRLFGHVLYFLVMIAGGLFFTTRRLNALFMR